MCFITILLRKCEEVKRVVMVRGATRRGRRGRKGRETVQSNRKYDCVWEALYYLSFG